MKKSLSIFLSVVMLLSFIACASNKTDGNESNPQTSGIPAKPDTTDGAIDFGGVKVTELAPVACVPNSDASFIPTSDELLFGKNEFIISGSVVNMREIKVEYKYEDTDVTDHMSIIDLAIDDVVYKASDAYSGAEKMEAGKTVSIGLPYNSHSFIESLPVVKVGKEFLIFCKSTAGMIPQNETQKLSSYVDFWCNAPQCMLHEKIEGSYLSDNYFKDHVPRSALIEFVLDSNDSLVGMDSDSTVTKASDLFKERVGNRSNSDSALSGFYVLIECEALKAAVLSMIEIYRSVG